MWQRTPVTRAISKTATFAMSSASGGRLAPCASGGVAPFPLELRGEASHDVRVLVVECHRKPGLRDDREDLEELCRVVPRKADGVVFVGRYLEGAGPGLGELRDAVRARSLAGGGVERDVDDGETLDRADLVAQALHRVDRMGIVERHVHDRRDPARGGSPGGVAQSLDAGGAPRVHLTVDDPGDHELAASIDGGIRGRRGTGPDRSDGPVRDAEIASGEHAIRKHEVAADHEIEHLLLSCSNPCLDQRGGPLRAPAPGGGALFGAAGFHKYL